MTDGQASADHGFPGAFFVRQKNHALSAVLMGASGAVMLKIGKLAQQAIAAASYLAEKYDEAETRVSAREIADVRDLPRPVVAKVLAQLSLHGITSGTTGPSGGYRLAKPPEEVTLHEIVAVFERLDVRPMCPFGPNWCGSGPPCPMHEAIARVSHDVERFLQNQNLGPFRGLNGVHARTDAADSRL